MTVHHDHDRPRNAYGQYIGKRGVPHPKRNIGPDTPAGYTLVVEDDKRRMTVGKLIERLQNYNHDLEVVLTARLQFAGGSITEFPRHVRIHDVGGRSFVEIVGDQNRGFFEYQPDK